jgi:hypothetical protein
MSPKPEATAEQAVPIEPLPPVRRAKLDAARQTWIRQLVDMSRRNNLLYFRELKVGTLDLTDAPAEAMQALLQSGKAEARVPLTDLVSIARKAQAVASLNDIAARARSNFEERGLDTLFLALGVASWTAPDGGRNAAAPVLLVPIEAAQSHRGSPRAAIDGCTGGPCDHLRAHHNGADGRQYVVDVLSAQVI